MIRQATLGDLEDLVLLETAGFPIDSFTRRQLLYLITKAQGICLVEEDGGRILGMLVLLWRRNSGSGSIYSVVVDPKVQGKGIGKRLMHEAEVIARQKGLKRLTLQVRLDNAVAIGLYKKLGYTEGGYLPQYYSDGQTAIHFRKPLTGPSTRSVAPPGGSREGKTPTRV